MLFRSTPSLDSKRWWRSGTGARFMTLEYCKYLAVLTREAIISVGSAADKANKKGEAGKDGAPQRAEKKAENRAEKKAA